MMGRNRKVCHMNVRIISFTAVAILAIIAGVIYCNPSVQKPHNVLLISVDTLRHDRLGYVGHFRPVSPHIDKLAEEGVVFRNAYSQSGWTLPSMATILTGKYPKDHGATALHRGMKRGLPTLASILREHGYDTRGHVSHILLTPKYGLDRGFCEYDYSVLRHGNPHNIATSKTLTDLALASLEQIEEPFFLWVHYFDPHFAYLCHDRWRAFGDTDVDRYDQEIAFTDYHIGRLIRSLRQSNLYKRTIIVMTSDHGEEFGEHGGKYHYTSYQEVLRVPLIIVAPFLKPGTSNVIAEQIDILPTILNMLGIEATGDFPGKDLWGDKKDNRPVFAERDRPPGFKQRTIIHGDRKLICIEEADTTNIPASSRVVFSEVKNVHPGVMMFDLPSDPAEKDNIFSQGDPTAETLLAILAAHFSGADLPTEEIQLDEETREKLRSLGYLN